MFDFANQVPLSQKLPGPENSIANATNSSINQTSESITKTQNEYGYIAMVTPLANQVARSVRAALQHLGWRKVSILTIGKNSFYSKAD